MSDCNSLQNGPEGIEPVKFHKMIAERAYLKAEKRSFAADYEMKNWLEAEQEVSNQCHNWSQEV